MSARRLALPVLAAAILAAGCGGPSGDLFAVERTGSIPGAELRLVVSDDGTVRCNGGGPKQIGDARLLSARELQRDLQDSARGSKQLPPGRSSVLAYKVRLPSGTLTYSDSSPGQTPAMLRLQGFVRGVAKHVCDFAR